MPIACIYITPGDILHLISDEQSKFTVCRFLSLGKRWSKWGSRSFILLYNPRRISYYLKFIISITCAPKLLDCNRNDAGEHTAIPNWKYAWSQMSRSDGTQAFSFVQFMLMLRTFQFNQNIYFWNIIWIFSCAWFHSYRISLLLLPKSYKNCKILVHWTSFFRRFCFSFSNHLRKYIAVCVCLCVCLSTECDCSWPYRVWLFMWMCTNVVCFRKGNYFDARHFSRKCMQRCHSSHCNFDACG